MSAETNKRLVTEGFLRLFNQGELTAADELVTPDFLNHDAPPGSPLGPVGLRQVVTMLRTAFPDLTQQIEEVIAEGDTVVVRTTFSGTHTGPFFGAPPTGRRFIQQQIHIFHIRDGKSAEHRAVRDDLGMMQQLGLIPDMSPASS